MTTAAEIQHLQEHGLYSAANEHDACGVGFVAHIKGAEVARHRRAGPADPREPRPPRRGRRRPADGRRRRHPDPDPRRVLPRGDGGKQGVDAAAAGRVRRRHGLPAARSTPRALACEQEIERAIKAEGQVLLGWRDVPVDDEMPISPTVRAKIEPVIRQVFIGRGADVIVHRRARAQALHHPQDASGHAIQALKLDARQGVLRAVDVGAHGRLQGHAARRPGRRVLPRPAGPARASRRWRWCTSASRPTPSPTWDLAHPFRMIAHNGEINTRARATSTGCARAKA